MRRSVLVVTLVVLLLGPLAAAPSAAATPEHTQTVFEVEVQADGNAVWMVSARYALSDANETAAFERLRAEYESGQADVGIPASVFRKAASGVAERTGRQMEITGVNRSSRLVVDNGSRVGVLTLRFTWTNFATVDGEAIAVGSAFEGGWFGDLAARQTLVIEPPSGYRVQTAAPSTDIIGGALQWEGPQAFDPGEPAVEFRPATTTSTSSTTSSTTPPGVNPTIQWLYPAVGFGALVVAGLLLVAWQGDYLSRSGAEDGGDGGDQDGGDEPRDAAPPSEPAEPTEEAESSGGVGETEETQDVDMDLLSDEERVEHILREHGGRMKQAQIVEETRWSNAKVSQLLSAMAEEGRVEKLRIGRENLISLPDEDETEER